LNRSGDSGHPFLIPDFRGNGFSFSPLCMLLAVYNVENFPSIPIS
jgi:hypothetical protein